MKDIAASRIRFKSPPLVELVLGAQFEKPFLSPEVVYQLYRDYFGSKFPTIQEREIVPTTIEKLDKETILSVPGHFQARKLFVNRANDELIQLQPDKFLYNWRRSKEGDTYPHFESVYSTFKDNLDLILKIAPNERINQLEITYVDHIEHPDFKIREFDLSTIFSFIKLPSIRGIDFKSSFIQPAINSNLYLTIRTAFTNVEKKPFIYVETTCRGFVASMSVEEWMIKARKSLVDFFLEITTEEAHEKWGILKE